MNCFLLTFSVSAEYLSSKELLLVIFFTPNKDPFLLKGLVKGKYHLKGLRETFFPFFLHLQCLTKYTLHSKIHVFKMTS